MNTLYHYVGMIVVWAFIIGGILGGIVFCVAMFMITRFGRVFIDLQKVPILFIVAFFAKDEDVHYMYKSAIADRSIKKSDTRVLISLVYKLRSIKKSLQP